MARRNKNIEVEINETKKNNDERTDIEILIREKLIGTVVQEKGKDVIVTYKEDKNLSARTVDEGIQLIISEYNLHDQ